MKVAHGDPIAEVVAAELHLDLEFVLEGEFLCAKEGEYSLVQFVHQSIPGELPIRYFWGPDPQCDSFQATVSHEKVSDAVDS